MNLVIYGAGGLAKEIFDTATTLERWIEIVFIDDFNHDRILYGKRVISLETLLAEFSLDDLEVIIGVGEPATRVLIFNRLVENELKFVTIIHPSAIISQSSTIGAGVYVGPFSFVSSETHISDNVLIQPHAMIGHNVSVGFSSVISPNSAIGGACQIGSQTYIALNSCIEQGKNIGDVTIIGMSSCVTKDIPSNVIAMGIPARILKVNEDKKVF